MAITAKVEESGHLLHNLVLFGRLLRELGLVINPERLITLIKALEYVNIAQKEEFYHAVRCLVVNDKDEIPIFDKAFEIFWRKPSQRGLRFQFQDLDQPSLPQPHVRNPQTNEEPSPLSKPVETVVEELDEDEDTPPSSI